MRPLALNVNSKLGPASPKSAFILRDDNLGGGLLQRVASSSSLTVMVDRDGRDWEWERRDKNRDKSKDVSSGIGGPVLANAGSGTPTSAAIQSAPLLPPFSPVLPMVPSHTNKDEFGLRVKNTWIALSFWMCGARHRDRLIISALIFTLVSLLTAIILLSVKVPPNPSKPATYPDLDSAMLTLDTHFPVIKSSGIDPSFSVWSSDWYADRRYGIVIDAGSSGSRLLVYSWKVFDHSIHRFESSAIPVIEKAFPDDSTPSSISIEPGLSNLASSSISLENTATYLEPLLAFAAATIPTQLHDSTPIYLLATAGMRLIKENQRNSILEFSCEAVKRRYKFDLSGGCLRQFRVISGESEGVFGWVAVNYLNGGFGDPSKQSTIPLEGNPKTYGFLDMGGASTQIAFEPLESMKARHADDLTRVTLRSVNGKNLEHQVFVSTFLGFGVNEARRQYLEGLALKAGFNLIEKRRKRQDIGGSLAANFNSSNDAGSPKTITAPNPTLKEHTATALINDPCLPNRLVLESDSYLSRVAPPIPSIVGSGSLLNCLAHLNPYLQKARPCIEEPCLFNGVHAPIANFSRHRFVGISEFFHTPTSVQKSLLTGGIYQFDEFIKSADKVCKGPWDVLKESFLAAHDGKISNLDENRLMLQCFKSAWVLEVLHDGFGIPKQDIIDSAGSHRSPQPFQPENKLKGFQISWTLGAILFHVSSTIPLETSNSSHLNYMWERVFLGLLCLIVALVLGVIFWRRYRRATLSLYRRRGSRMEYPPLTTLWQNQMDEVGLLGSNSVGESETIEMH